MRSAVYDDGVYNERVQGGGLGGKVLRPNSGTHYLLDLSTTMSNRGKNWLTCLFDLYEYITNINVGVEGFWQL